jgi:hypothetical protein
MGGRLTFLRANLRFYPIKRKERKSRIISRAENASVQAVRSQIAKRPRSGSSNPHRTAD